MNLTSAGYAASRGTIPLTDPGGSQLPGVLTPATTASHPRRPDPEGCPMTGVPCLPDIHRIAAAILRPSGCAARPPPGICRWSCSRLRCRSPRAWRCSPSRRRPRTGHAPAAAAEKPVPVYGGARDEGEGPGHDAVEAAGHRTGRPRAAPPSMPVEPAAAAAAAGVSLRAGRSWRRGAPPSARSGRGSAGGKPAGVGRAGSGTAGASAVSRAAVTVAAAGRREGSRGAGGDLHGGPR